MELKSTPGGTETGGARPTIIQGGMGVGVSHWRLARAVAQAGQLGVVSGTALDTVLARRLQLGDLDGDMRRAIANFPFPAVSERVLAAHFIRNGKLGGEPFHPLPMISHRPGVAAIELLVLANFVEVWLAKEGHTGRVGINYLHKVQMPTLPSLYGALLAGVDYVLMGAGIPMTIPGILDQLSRGEAVRLKLEVEEALPDEVHQVTFDPAEFCGGPPPRLRRPQFVAIIASSVLALTLARKANGCVDGFVVEGSSAGGHNAPPRGGGELSERGEPVYGLRDVPDLEKIRALGVPFWLAGGYATAARLTEALAAGAAGVQVGTAFAWCDESGIAPQLKSEALRAARAGTAEVFTDPAASPTGFPFKVLSLTDTLSEPEVYSSRPRICDLGYLRRPYRRTDGTLGFRCPGEPVDHYLAKGGKLADTVGRKCLCNGLTATVGLGQTQAAGYVEPALVTTGDDVTGIIRFLAPGRDSYSAADVIRCLLGEAPQPSGDSQRAPAYGTFA